MVNSTLFAQKNADKIGESKHFEFFSNYWFNLHHFLYQEALMLKISDKTTLVPEELQSMSADQKSLLDKAISYYQSTWLEEDLRMSAYMTAFKHWITATQSKPSLVDIPDEFRVHCEELIKVSDLYAKIFWPKHQVSNELSLQTNLPLIKKIEADVVHRLSILTRAYWQESKIRVDISYYAKTSSRSLRNSPYTSIFPTHIVMNSRTSADIPGNWLELLFHEASHNLISSRSGFVGGTIMDVAKSLNKKSLRDQWHAYLFYLSGIVVKDEMENLGIPNYELYMKRNKVFSSYLPFLEQFLLPYIHEEVSLARATENIILNFK